MHTPLLLLLILANLGTFAQAQKLPAEAPEPKPLLPQVKVDYAASFTEYVGGMNVDGTDIYTPGRLRTDSRIVELDVRGVSIRTWKPAARWMKQPGQASFKKLPLNKGAYWHDLEGEKTSVGAETLNGIKTQKFKYKGTFPSGKSAKGFLWLDKNGILIKIVSGGGKTAARYEVKKLTIEPQDKQRFKVPTD